MTGRPRKEPPPDAAVRIRELAAEGHSIIGIASWFGVSHETLNRWLKERPDLKEQFDLGRDRERFVLTNLLYQKAVQGDTIAAIYLLKSRHNMQDNGSQADGAGGGRVNVTIQLPGALPMSALPVIEHGSTIPQPIAIPAPRSDDT